MSEQGAPPQHRPEDGWWQSVYTGPSATLPDTPLAAPDATTVDDWFDSAVGMIGRQRTTDVPPHPADPAHPETVDDWFDSAVGMIGPQQPAAPTPVDAVVAGPVDATAVGSADRDGAGPVAEDIAAPADAVGTDALSSEQSPAPSDASAALPEPAAGPAETAQQPEPAVPRAHAPISDASPEAERRPSPDLTPPDDGAAADHEPSADVPAAETLSPEPTPVDAVTAPAAPAVPMAPVAPVASVPPLRRPRVETPVPHVGERPPTYAAEPTAVPEADPEALSTVVPDTVIDGGQYGATTVRAVSIRGDSARYRGEPRRDALLLTRFGEGAEGLLVAVLAGPGRGESALDGSAAAAEAARQLAAAIGRSRGELAADLRAGARDRLRYGLQRLTNRAALPLRTAAEVDGRPDAVPGSLHCLLISLDPEATHRAAFGTGPGGLYLLRSGHWIDAYAARLLHHPDGEPPLPPAPGAPPRPFRFRLVPATPGDILLLTGPGLADPLAEEPAVAHFLANHWAHPHPPGSVDFLRQVQVRAKGYADDRTAIALWAE